MVSKTQVKKIVLSFSGAEEGTSYGYPSYKVAGKFFTRLRDEDASLVMSVGSIDERDMLLAADPAIFHITDHYKNYPYVLVRIAKIGEKELRVMLERLWRKIAPKKLSSPVYGGGAPQSGAEGANASVHPPRRLRRGRAAKGSKDRSPTPSTPRKRGRKHRVNADCASPESAARCARCIPSIGQEKWEPLFRQAVRPTNITVDSALRGYAGESAGAY